jgi:hypothetical protein
MIGARRPNRMRIFMMSLLVLVAFLAGIAKLLNTVNILTNERIQILSLFHSVHGSSM